MASLIWTAIKESGKVFLVYADFIKDCIFLAIIIQAVGGITKLQKSPDWNFASTVSLKRFSPKQFPKKPKTHLYLQVVFVQFLLLWSPMFASSWSFAISNPGFTFGLEPGADLTEWEEPCFIFLDLLCFLVHPIVLKFRSSSLCQEQEAIEKSLDLRLSEQYDKNSAKITILDQFYYGYKRIELNMETIIQMVLSLILFLYGKSSTTIANSLKALFSDEVAIPDKSFQDPSFARVNAYWFDFNTILDGIDPTYAIVFNFGISVLSFTRYVFLKLCYCKSSV